MASRYYKKSQRHFGLFTQGNEWMHPATNEEYIGPYHYFGDKEIIFTGASNTRESQVLIPYVNFAIAPQNYLYNKITRIDLAQYIPPVPKKPKPTLDDTSKGYMMRYFIKKSNDITAPCIEIDQKQYKKCVPKPGMHINGALYNKISLRWKLTGPRKDNHQIKGIEDTNRRTVFAKNMTMAGLIELLRDLTRYTEYDQIDLQKGAGLQVDDFFETNGSEFVFTDGTPYTGFYHIHPIYGAMVGKKHSDTFDQDRLMSFAEYSVMKSTADKAVK
tara:strand:+ start:133 stop:951 length:819 start_codon:yes stop_codon:yes gene_type:complete